MRWKARGMKDLEKGAHTPTLDADVYAMTSIGTREFADNPWGAFWYLGTAKVAARARDMNSEASQNAKLLFGYWSR